MATASDSMAELLRARWVRAVDLLWRETVRRRKALADAERLQATRRVKALRRIVRRAFAEYHGVEIAHGRRAERPS